MYIENKILNAIVNQFQNAKIKKKSFGKKEYKMFFDQMNLIDKKKKRKLKEKD